MGTAEGSIETIGIYLETEEVGSEAIGNYMGKDAARNEV